jgi:single-strand DNA-binding protein
MSSTSITVIGNIVTEPDVSTVANGSTRTRLRLASTDRKFNRTTGAWEDGNTSFYNVTCWRMLAERVGTQLKKGDPVIVTGKVLAKQWQRTDGSWGGCTDIDAFTIGPDLCRVAVTVNRQPRMPAEPSVASEATAPTQPVDIDPWSKTAGTNVGSGVGAEVSEPAA